MAEAGAICVAEPSGAGEILGAKRFREFTAPYINRLLDAIEAPVKIVHICGKLRAVCEELGALHCDALSFDAIVNAREMRPYLPGKAVMGDVSPHAIGTMPEEKVRGLTLSTPLCNIRAMVAEACGEETSVIICPLTVRGCRQKTVSRRRSRGGDGRNLRRLRKTRRPSGTQELPAALRPRADGCAEVPAERPGFAMTYGGARNVPVAAAYERIAGGYLSPHPAS